jgi:hypothetical protein
MLGPYKGRKKECVGEYKVGGRIALRKKYFQPLEYILSVATPRIPRSQIQERAKEQSDLKMVEHAELPIKT